MMLFYLILLAVVCALGAVVATLGQMAEDRRRGGNSTVFHVGGGES